MIYAGEENLVKKELKVYHYICDFIFQNHYSPSTTNIAEGVGLSIGTVPVYLHRLAEKGLIRMTESQSKSIVLNMYEYNYIEKVS